jgi:hypothetical protein
MNVDVNYLAVFLAAASSMVVGAVWYARPVFGNLWQSLVGLNEKQMKESAPMALGGAFVLSLVTAYVLAHVTFLSNDYFGNSFLQDALSTAFWLWLGLTAARMAVHDLFERRRKKLMLLNVAHEFVTLMVMGLIIGVLGR